MRCPLSFAFFYYKGHKEKATQRAALLITNR